MPPKPTTIDDFLARLSADKRAALEKLRRDIHAAAPGVEEVISYGIPGFRYDGRLLVWFGAGANHCSFYPGALPIAVRARELAGYATSKGTIRFAPDEPLPTSLVATLVAARVAENASRSAATSAKRGKAKKAKQTKKAASKRAAKGAKARKTAAKRKVVKRPTTKRATAKRRTRQTRRGT